MSASITSRMELVALAVFLILPSNGMWAAENQLAPGQVGQGQAVKARAGQKRVSFGMKRDGDDGPLRVEWVYPHRLARTFEAQPSEEARTAFGIAEMRKQEEGGDRVSAFELGYFYLYGIGVPRDLKEAEARLRVGLDIGRPEGAWRLAWELANGDEGDRDLPKAAELVMGALGGGCRQAIPTAHHVAHYFVRKAAPPDLPRAKAILDAVLKLDPENEYALVQGADVRFRQNDFSGAWEMATSVLGVADLTTKTRVRARLLRWAVAQKAGKVGEIEAADFREPLAYLTNKTPRVAVVIGAVVASGVALGILGLLAFLTRRYGADGPGIFLTAGWIGIPAFAFGLGLLSPASAAAIGLAVLITAILALSRDLRGRYLPMSPRPSSRVVIRFFAAMVGCLAFIFACGLGYEAAFKAVFGRAPDLQLVAALLRADNPRDFAALFFAGAICIPVVEEIAFRGFMLDWLRRRLSWFWAIAVCGIGFGMIHGPVAALPTAVIGLAAGWLRLRFGNLWPAIFLHGLNNGIAVTLLWLDKV